MPQTRQPRRRQARVKCEPMKPRQPVTQTVPTWYTQWGQRIFVQPPPSGAGTLSLLVSVNSDTVTDLPMSYRHLLIPGAVYRAKIRDRKFTEYAQLYAEYANSLMYQRQDLQERGTDTKADQDLPDRAERVMPAGS